jgi:tripartite-type tricarboxylate transporter receptor subunit TctC
MINKRRAILKGIGAMPLLALCEANAQQFPLKPITIIVPASPGTGIDILTRYIAQELAKRLGKPTIVENRSGAGGVIGFSDAAKAPPDGYTLIMAGIPMYLTALLFPTAPPPFDPVKDFTPIARIANVSQVIVVAANSPYRTFPELLDAMKSHPGMITYSSQGVGSTAQVCMVALNAVSKTKAQHVGYRDTTGAVTDVVGDRVVLTCQGAVSVLSLVRAGKLRALAVTGTKRSDALPDIPTVAESGVPGFEISSWISLMAPAHIPETVQKLLSEEVTRIALTPAFADYAKKQVMSADVAGYRQLIKEAPAEAERWEGIARLVRSS